MEIDEFQSLQFSETLSGSQKAPELTRKLKVRRNLLVYKKKKLTIYKK
jgi:hypothetical protein